MAIVALSKVSLCGLLKEKTDILDALQRLGCLHLQPLRPPPAEPETVPPEHAENVHKALRFLLDTPLKRRQVTAAMLDQPAQFDLPGVVSETLKVQQREREISDRRDFLAQRIKQLQPWGDFTLPPEDQLAGYKLWFYLVPLSQMRLMPRKNLVWQQVHKDNQNAYIVVVAKTEPAVDALPVPRVHTGAVSLSELRRRLYRAQMELEELSASRQALTRWIFLLTQNMARADDRAALSHAAAQTLDSDQVFAVQGWLAREALDALRDFARRHGLALLVQPPQPGDTPPTLLHNPEPLSGGEAVVRFYQIPAYQDWDPSTILYFSFALFFAMIISDAGYGALFALALLAGWRKLSRSGARHLRGLCATLVGGTCVWGVMAGSYFGVPPPASSFAHQLKLFDLQDFDTMMRLSVVIGVAHIGVANAAMAWHNRGQPRAWARLGWVLAVLGGLVMWLGRSWPQAPAFFSAGNGFLDAQLLGSGLLGIGLLAVFWFSARQVAYREPTAWYWQLLAGLKELTGVSRIFGDILSYLRLFALGLASASLALTFNQLAAQVSAAVPGVGLLLSLLILLLGHGLNLLLAVVSGVVHGLRLNFIEFYNWGLSGEGRAFRPFAKKEDTRL
ncbi:MAG: hypothetical protein P8Y42_08155 [Exilibacterium sp.]